MEHLVSGNHVIYEKIDLFFFNFQLCVFRVGKYKFIWGQSFLLKQRVRPFIFLYYLLFFTSHLPTDDRTRRSLKYSYILSFQLEDQNCKQELYNLKKDPSEEYNLVSMNIMKIVFLRSLTIPFISACQRY